MTDTNPTHCIDCRHCIPAGSPKGCCSNPAVLTLTDEQRAQYDDPLLPCPVFDPKNSTPVIEA